MNLDVYDTENDTFLGTLSSAYNMGFVADVHVPGMATFRVDVESEADIALLQPRRWVRWRRGANPGEGDIFGCVRQDRPANVRVPDEQPYVHVDCPGGLSVLGYGSVGGAVFAPHGAGTDLSKVDGRQQNPRIVGWTSEDYDDSLWGGVAGPMVSEMIVEGWPDDDTAAFLPIFPGEKALYRRLLPTTEEAEGPARMFLVASWNTAVTVWLDNDVVMSKEAGQTGVIFEDVEYEEFDHQLAVEVTGGFGRWGWVWVQLDRSLNSAGDEVFSLGSVLRRTFDPADFPAADSDWFSYEGDLPYPGVTVGFVAGLGLDESQARGEVTYVGRDFTAALDSAGVAWEHEFSRGFRIGTLGQVLDSLAEFGAEPEMIPDGTLRIFQPHTRGTDRTATVQVTAPAGLALSGRGVQSTRLLFETPGGFGWGVNADAEAEFGTVMAAVTQLGEDLDPDSVADVVMRTLEEEGRLLDEVDVDLPKDIVPYEHVFLGDTVTCVSAVDGSTGPVRITSFTLSVDDDTGEEYWTATGVPVDVESS